MSTLTDAFLADLDALSDGDEQAHKEEGVTQEDKVLLRPVLERLYIQPAEHVQALTCIFCVICNV
jgi:hypothetical protein